MNRNVLRQVKNVVKNYTDVQVKVREATSNDPWGPSSTQMSEIADLTYNHMAFTEIMDMIWRRLNDHGKNWRHVLKSLVLLDYIIKTGSDKVAVQCKENLFAVQTLKDFQRLEDGKDVGNSVREKAKAIVSLLQDEERLKNERIKAIKAKERMAGRTDGYGPDSVPALSTHSESTRHQSDGLPHEAEPAAASSVVGRELEITRPTSSKEEQLQLEMALALSREEHDQHQRTSFNDHKKLQFALEESKRLHKQTNVSQPSNTETLLDISLGPSTSTGSQPAGDPWALPSQPPNLTPPNPTPSTTDPWAAVDPPAATTDPWCPTTTTASSSAAATDPWSPAATTTSDPWQPTASNGRSLETADEFASIATGPPLADDQSAFPAGLAPMPALQASGGAGDGGDLTAAKAAENKPVSFLGEHGNLVNLDNLVSQNASSSQAGGYNPFSISAETSASARLGTGSNPFKQAEPKVSINQMRQQQGFAQTTSTTDHPGAGVLLPQPLLPAPTSSTNPFI